MQVQIKRRIEEGRRKESTSQSSHIISVVLFLYGLPVPAADELSDICSSRDGALLLRRKIFTSPTVPEVARH